MEARRRIGREGFDLVIVAVYLGNDVVPRRIERYPPGPPVDVPIHRFRWPQCFCSREFVDAVLYPINDFLKGRSQLFNFLKQRAGTLRMRLGLTAEYLPTDLLRREANSPRWAWRRNRRISARARPVTTNCSQSGDGACSLVVMIST